jgi:hypothetical protein
MSGKIKAVFGIYASGEMAELAVDKLVASGFFGNDISVLMPDARSTKDFAHESPPSPRKAPRSV